MKKFEKTSENVIRNGKISGHYGETSEIVLHNNGYIKTFSEIEEDCA